MITVKTVDFGYDEPEDRLVLDCSDERTVRRFSLTRRLVRRLLPVLAGALERSSPAVRQAAAADRREVIALEHLSSLAVQSPPAEPRAPGSPAPERVRLDGVKVAKVNLDVRPVVFILTLHSEDEALATLSLNRGELHRVLAALDHWARNAEWDINGETGWLDGAAQTAISVTGRNAS